MTRVLIVDDDIQPLRAPWINLTTRGCTVVIAADDRTALHAAADRSPEVIVLDLGLPDLDGADVITELRTFTQAPIIVHSARTDPRDTVHALDRGADDYVTKPLGVDELAARLRAAVRAPPPSPPTARRTSQSGRHHIWVLPTARRPATVASTWHSFATRLERDPARPRRLIIEAGMGYRFRT